MFIVTWKFKLPIIIVKYEYPVEKKTSSEKSAACMPPVSSFLKMFSHPPPSSPVQSMPFEAYHLDSSAFPDCSIWIFVQLYCT